MSSSSAMWPLKFLFAVVLVQQACLSEQMRAHLDSEIGPRMDLSIQGNNPMNGLNGALGSNIANLFNPMGAVNAAFSALNGILKPALSSTASATTFNVPSFPGFSGGSNGASHFSLQANGGNAPLSNSGSNTAAFSIHNLGSSQPTSGVAGSDGAVFSLRNGGGSAPTSNSGSFGLDISGTGLTAGSNEAVLLAGGNSAPKSNLLIDLNGAGVAGTGRPGVNINLGSHPSSSGSANSETSSSATGAGSRGGLRGRSLRVSGHPPKAAGRSASQLQDRLTAGDSSRGHINLSGSTNQLSLSSHGSSGSNLDGSSTVSMARTLGGAKPHGSSMSFSTSSVSKPSTSLGGSLDSSSSRRSFTVLDNTNSFSSSHAGPSEHRISFHTGGGQPEADVIEISRSTYLVSPKPATFRSSVVQHKY